MLDLLCIAVITVFVIDLSGFVDTIKRYIWKWLLGDKPYQDYSIKPWTCSLCMTHHICVIYALICGYFSLPIWMYICGLSFLTPQIKGFLMVIKDMLIKAENAIYNILDK